MNLPFILDLAIGLIFVYLILSLLASEIQELLTTLLQWRAEHLRNSIEVMLSGGTASSEMEKTKALVNDLYNHPLINTLNQEAKGKLAQTFRGFGNSIIQVFAKITKTENTFGDKNSAPSYIPPEAFAASVMEKLHIKEFARVLAANRFTEFKEFLYNEVLKIVSIGADGQSYQEELTKELNKLYAEFNQIIEEFKTGTVNLELSIYNVALKLGYCIEALQTVLPKQPETQELIERLTRLRKEYFGNDIQRKILGKKLNPNVSEVIEEFRRNGDIAAEVKRMLQDKDSAAYHGFEQLLNNLPDSVKESMAALSKKVREQGEELEQDIDKFQQEIEQWFNRSLDRASGVYKRNAKGVAIIIGFLVAVASNADTMHIVDRLSKDSVLRGTISNYATDAVANNGNLDEVSQKVRAELNSVGLPIGWNSYNLNQQTHEEFRLPTFQEGVDGVPIPFVKRVLGWSISGVAISMGSGFWFDLLGKVINVKSMGKKSQ
ncbi:hypothetical protein [[Phormidium] sp. ETS-05]|uniref:hypothetical protein n=1 Tax=[Phormidium] sp. ETS-05 TaxID=222819 RepID=UPI0018EF0CF1|nr:hypothetical protein [[Phormidium] sp. ETS-05]